MAFALLAVLIGPSLMIGAGVLHRRRQARAMDQLLGMAPPSVTHRHKDESSALADRAVDLAGQFVDHVDSARSLRAALERAGIPLRPGEFVIVVVAICLGIAALVLAVTHAIVLAVVTAGISAIVSVQFLKRRVTKRRRAFESQLPDALSLVASSLSAGHTFLRAIQMMCQESGPPMSEEFARVVSDTSLGDSVTSSLNRMAARLQIRDVDMVVQAIRIQQSVGGRLAELLHTLADVIRARDEVRREVQVLTAEGRLSAYVLAGLVPFLFVTMQFVNPGYVKPLYHGWGLGLLIGCGLSVLAGMFIILRMVKIEV